MRQEELRRIELYTLKGRSDLRNLSPEEMDDFANLISLRIIEGEVDEICCDGADEGF
jgi:hypothetical protein